MASTPFNSTPVGDWKFLNYRLARGAMAMDPTPDNFLEYCVMALGIGERLPQPLDPNIRAAIAATIERMRLRAQKEQAAAGHWIAHNDRPLPDKIAHEQRMAGWMLAFLYDAAANLRTNG